MVLMSQCVLHFALFLGIGGGSLQHMAEGQSQNCSLFCIYIGLLKTRRYQCFFCSTPPSGTVTQSSATTKPHVLSYSGPLKPQCGYSQLGKGK